MGAKGTVVGLGPQLKVLSESSPSNRTLLLIAEMQLIVFNSCGLTFPT